MRRLISFLVPLVAALMVTPLAFAAWLSTGAGSGTATATSVNAGSSPMADWGDGTVLLSWDASTLTSGAAVGYYDVIRFSGGDTTPVCQGVTGTSCTDLHPLPGPVSYVVVPRIGAHWEGLASESTAFQYDVFPPTTSVATRTPDPNAAGWNKDDVVITLTATDQEPVPSGVKEIHYELNGVETAVAGSSVTFTVSREQVTEVAFWAVDKLDNSEVKRTTDDVQVDKTAPVTEASVSPPPNLAGWNNSDASVSLNALDAVSGLASTEYSLTGGVSWTPYTVPIQISTEGTYTVTYRSTDTAGNVESSKSKIVKLDKRAPDSSGSLVGSTVTLSANDVGPSGVASIVYKIGAAATYATYTAPFALASGETVAFHAIDYAGNVESLDKTLSNVPSDTTGPVISFVDLVSGATYVNNSGGTNPWSSVCSTGQICATVTDTSGVDAGSVKYTLEATSGNNAGKCWNGSGFVAKTAGLCAEVSMTLTGGRYVGGVIPNGSLKSGGYTATVKAKDSSSSANPSSVSRSFIIS